MEKKIYLFFGLQCKCAKFCTKTDKIDQETVYRKIEDLCERDVNLKIMRQNKTIVLQLKDEDKNIWCDVEEDDEFSDKTEINVIFIPLSYSTPPATFFDARNVIKMTTFVLHDNRISSNEVNFSDFRKYLHFWSDVDSYMLSKHDHLCEESSNTGITYIEPVDNQHRQIGDRQNQQDSEGNHNRLIKGAERNIVSVDVYPEPDCSGLSSGSPSYMNVRDTSFSTLPPLTFDLNEKIKRKGILGSQKDLIYHWGCYLWENTEGRPKKQDYQRLASTIVRTYPVLGSSDGDSVIIRKSLSTWIRNHRANLKNQAAKRDHEGQVVNSGSAKKEEEQYDVEQTLEDFMRYSQCLAFTDNYCTNSTTHLHQECEDVKTPLVKSADNEDEFSGEESQHCLEEKRDSLSEENNGNFVSVDVYAEPSCSQLSSRSPSFMDVRDTSFSTLPPLTFDLGEKIRKKGILGSQKDLIYHWGCYLWENTEGSPKRQDYQRLASTIVRHFPVLGSSEGDSVIIRRSLSTWIRNHRAILKNQAAKKNQTKHTFNFTSNVDSVKKEEEQYNVEQALKELDEKQKEGDTPHIRFILTITLPYRRTWIKKSAKSVNEIIKKYPHLANSELVIFEFCNLKHLTQEFMSTNIDKMFNKLTKFFSTEKNDDKTKAFCIQLLYNRVTTIKKNIQPLMTIEEANLPDKNPTAFDEESPRIVLYTNEDDIETAYIVADTELNLKIEKPSMTKIIMVLLAAYYVWDVTYPKPYRNILEYLDHEVIGTPIDRKNVVLLKFIRQRDSEEQSINNGESVV